MVQNVDFPVNTSLAGYLSTILDLKQIAYRDHINFCWEKISIFSLWAISWFMYWVSFSCCMPLSFLSGLMVFGLGLGTVSSCYGEVSGIRLFTTGPFI